MPRVLITTVGTSLLTNRNQRPWAGWDGRRKHPLPAAQLVDAWLDQADPVVASDETNTLRGGGLAEDDRVVFDPAAATGPAVKVLDANQGKIAVRYSVGDEKLPLAVLTTAREQAQTELVAEYLRRMVK